MKKLTTLIASAAMFVSVTSAAYAGFNDPWYLAYKVNNGSLIHYLGPYNTKWECLSKRWSLGYGKKFIGCFQ